MSRHKIPTSNRQRKQRLSQIQSIKVKSVISGRPLRIFSLMPENSVIFSDGIENDFVQSKSGIEAAVTLAEKKGDLIV